MINGYKHTVTNRFLSYVAIDTQSNPDSKNQPSTEKQKKLTRYIVDELVEMGIVDVSSDEYGYVYATIHANTYKKNVPTICFCSHLDTSPDCDANNVKPIVHENYQGGVIYFPDDPILNLNPNESPYLLEHIDNNIITASGLTLLGADDKSGVAIIMDLAAYLINNPQIKHGTIKLLFTTDEEIGRGTENIDLKKLDANYAYTLDGGKSGTLEDETFHADSAQLTIFGNVVHPGYAKNKMVNAIKIASEIVSSLPKDRLSPETTEKREGFIHPVKIEGLAEEARLEFIIRDFDLDNLWKHESFLLELVNNVFQNYPTANFELKFHEQYRNMKEVLDTVPFIVQYAEEAYTKVGLKIEREPVRGGTDGSRLSYMGLPCANLFTGMQAIHSKKEWIGVKDMEKAVEMLVELVQVWERNS